MSGRRSDPTDKMRAFVAEYLRNGRNASLAYRTAVNPKTAPNVAAVRGHEMLKHPKVKPLIDQAEAAAQTKTAAAIDRYAVSKARIVEELAKIGFANMNDFVEIDANGQATLNLKKADRDHLAAVSEITIDEDGKVKFKLHNKPGSLVDLAKIMGYVVDRHAHRVVRSFSDLSDDELDSLARELGPDDAPQSRRAPKKRAPGGGRG